MKADKKRLAWITIANVLACFGVVVLHVNIDFWRYSNTPLWQLRNFIQSSFYWPVPVLVGNNGIDYLLCHFPAVGSSCAVI